jgi:catechol 2,3-dioxygenase
MPRRLISQLAHVEILSPKPEESVAFLTDVLGMEETERSGESVFLRAWGDWFHHSLVVTEGAYPGLGHIGWRAEGPEELEIAAQRLIDDGAADGWVEDAVGHGRAIRFRGPGGQPSELTWEIALYEAPPELRSSFPNRPQRFAPRGAAVRQIDHTTAGSPNPVETAKWYRDTLGFRFTEYVTVGERPVMAMVTNNEKSHELGLVPDLSGIPGRTHHVAYWLDDPAEVIRAADIVLEAGFPLEYGPTRHGMGENTCLYFREPGGMRIELYSGGYRNYLPDWGPVHWSPEQGPLNFYRNYEFASARELLPPDDAVRPDVGLDQQPVVS